MFKSKDKEAKIIKYDGEKREMKMRREVKGGAGQGQRKEKPNEDGEIDRSEKWMNATES